MNVLKRKYKNYIYNYIASTLTTEMTHETRFKPVPFDRSLIGILLT